MTAVKSQLAEKRSLIYLSTRGTSGNWVPSQEASVFRKLTVRENLQAILETRNQMTNQQRESLTDSLIEEFRIAHIQEQLGLSLSGGERRRVEIARALATNPDFILLDEPFAGVDPISVNDIKDIVRHLTDRGIGILITDHNVRETLDICDKAYIVNTGRIIAEGTRNHTSRWKGQICLPRAKLQDVDANLRWYDTSMALKPSLALKLGQQLRMTPQLQQAIKLLQLSSLDLEQEIQEVLDSNIMLEEIDTELGEISQEESSLDVPEETIEGADNTSDTNIDGFESTITVENTDTQIDTEIEGETVKVVNEVSGEYISEDLPVVTTWDDLYDDYILGSSGEANISGDNFLETRNSVEVTIKSHLTEQTNLLNLTKPDEYIAESIIDGLDDDGMLQVAIEDICEAAPDEWNIGTEEVEAVLHLIQRLDPLEWLADLSVSVY